MMVGLFTVLRRSIDSGETDLDWVEAGEFAGFVEGDGALLLRVFDLDLCDHTG